MTDYLSFNPTVLVRVGFPALGRRFLTWKIVPPEKPGKKPRKVPCDARRVAINYTDERRWIAFDEAVAIARRCRLGLGIGLGWGLAGLDLDDCLDACGAMSREATLILRHFPTYTEVSPTGTGTKSYFLSGPFQSAKRDDQGIELYGGRRWFALTGRPLRGTVLAITECGTAARTLRDVLRPPSAPRRARAAAPPSGDARARLEDCGTVRERPSHLGGTIYTLRRCPFTNDEHKDGGPYAIVFNDGGVLFRCDRSVHGPLRQWYGPAGATLRTTNQ
jgi:hypothetical protein